MLPRRHTLVIVLAVFAVIVFVTNSGLRDGEHIVKGGNWFHPTAEKEPKLLPCSEHLGWLEPYQFSYPIQYVSREIITTPSPTFERPSLTTVDEPLFAGFTNVDLTQSATVEFPSCLPPLTLEVPHGKLRSADASHMIFGLQTTMKRLKDTVKHLGRWLPHTNARLYAIVIENEETPADDKEMANLEKEFHALDMDVSVIHPVRVNDTFAQRYFSLVDVMYNASNEKTQWICLVDDDTFFPSMHDLTNLLSKYDSSKQQYLGSLSEDWWAVNHYGLMGFGGAGIMLSVPMAEVIHNHNDDCKEHLRTTAGDISVMDCIYQFSTTKLTHIASLHQVDMHGDLSGFYESGREMLSLHHWKEGSAAGYKLEMEKMHLVADICDSCFLQRWQFPNELVLTNGFSINTYPEGSISGQKSEAERIDLMQIEKTWGDDITVLHSLAPTRDKLSEELKVGYKLLDSMIIDGDVDAGRLKDTVRQVYFKEGVEREGGPKEMDTVMVLNWRAGPDAGLPPLDPPKPESQSQPESLLGDQRPGVGRR